MEPYYQTKDTNLAAFLYASGQRLERVSRDGKICWFEFEKRIECEILAQDYWSGVATCNPKLFADALRTLKDLIFSQN